MIHKTISAANCWKLLCTTLDEAAFNRQPSSLLETVLRVFQLRATSQPALFLVS